MILAPLASLAPSLRVAESLGMLRPGAGEPFFEEMYAFQALQVQTRPKLVACTGKPKKSMCSNKVVKRLSGKVTRWYGASVESPIREGDVYTETSPSFLMETLSIQVSKGGAKNKSAKTGSFFVVLMVTVCWFTGETIRKTGEGVPIWTRPQKRGVSAQKAPGCWGCWAFGPSSAFLCPSRTER